MYTVHEIFLSVQGEGYNVGRVAVFCRFAGCNLWTGREEDRAKAVCKFCDTTFIGPSPDGGKYLSSNLLSTAILSKWPALHTSPFVILTGGEPVLQVKDELISLLHARNAYVALETNGSLAVGSKPDWITVSPKANARFIQREGHELKLAWPQEGFDLEQLSNLNFRHFWLQPIDGPNLDTNRKMCFDACKRYPRWRLSTQMHKIIGLR